MKSKLVYGPVKARRLGNWEEKELVSCADSLGINLANYPVCSFGCVYCSMGKTENLTSSPKKGDYIDIDTFANELEREFERHKKQQTSIDYISFVGWTEPTLHPLFPGVVDAFYKVKEKYFPNKPTGIFTNATTLGNSEVRKAIRRFDRTFFKVDASTERIFRVVNKPARGISLDSIVKNLELISSEGANVEMSSMILNLNYRDLMTDTYLDIARKIEPKDGRIYLCTPDWDTPTEKGMVSLMPEPEKIQQVVNFLSQSEFKPILLKAKREGLHPLAAIAEEKW